MLSDETPLVSYAANGTTYAITFDFDDDADIAVALFDDDGVKTDLTNPTDYDVVDSDVELGSEPTEGTVVIYRVQAQAQEDDYEYNGSLSEEVLEASLDRIVRMIQDLQEQVDRCIKVDRNRRSATVVIPSDSALASTTVGFDASGNVQVT